MTKRPRPPGIPIPAPTFPSVLATLHALKEVVESHGNTLNGFTDAAYALLDDQTPTEQRETLGIDGTGGGSTPTLGDLGVSAFWQTVLDDADAATSRGNLVAQRALQFQDTGSNIGTSGAVFTVNFVGAGVTASESAGTVTVSISGGGGGGGGGSSYFPGGW